MTSDDPDRRIEDLEKELAKIQSEETTPRQLEANLTRDSLKKTLGTAAVFAVAIQNLIDGLTREFAASVDRMTGDLNGGHDGR